MQILIIKTSSLGDVVHNLPVITDIRRHFPEAQIDWCVEEGFSAIPALHPGVRKVLPVALRRWKKHLFQSQTWQEIKAVRRQLAEHAYDAVIDTQGLLKSAWITRWANGPVAGYAADSAREPLSARFYDDCFSIPKGLHAVERNRKLVAAALDYVLDGELDYGIEGGVANFNWLPPLPYVVFLTASSRDDKLWPEANWLSLGMQFHYQGFSAVLPAGSQIERERAARLAEGIPGAVAAPALSIPELAGLLRGASAVVGVDTGLTHLAVALKRPCVALYTATDPGLTGVLGAGFYRNLGGKGQLPEVDEVIAALKMELAR